MMNLRILCIMQSRYAAKSRRLTSDQTAVPLYALRGRAGSVPVQSTGTHKAVISGICP